MMMVMMTMDNLAVNQSSSSHSSSAIELEVERRQLIEEQIVRRKRIHNWIVTADKSTGPDPGLPSANVITAESIMDTSSNQPSSSNDDPIRSKADQAVQTESLDEHEYLRSQFDHNRKRLQVRFEHQMAAQRRRQQSQEHLHRLHERHRQHHQQQQDQQQLHLRHHRSQHPSHRCPGKSSFFFFSSVLKSLSFASNVFSTFVRIACVGGAPWFASFVGKRRGRPFTIRRRLCLNSSCLVSCLHLCHTFVSWSLLVSSDDAHPYPLFRPQFELLLNFDSMAQFFF